MTPVGTCFRGTNLPPRDRPLGEGRNGLRPTGPEKWLGGRAFHR